ncbi:MAG: hypothetical protein KF864_12620 [Phycisphaeraceae bacterium]|nr:hypothetical protein [Phycisphaeraceae bacterium]
MTDLLNSVLGVKDLRWGDEGVSFGFALGWPAWAWVGIAAACFAVALASYWRLEGNRIARITLGCARALLLLLLALLIAGPQLIRPQERVEQDWVVFLVDRSASMNVADAGLTPDAPRTRDQHLTQTFADSASMLGRIAGERNALFLGFDGQVFDLSTTQASPGAPLRVETGTAQGQRTMIGAALEQTLRRMAAKPLAGLVLLSDGRSADLPGRALIRQFEARGVPVFAVPLGSSRPLPDLAVTRTESPAVAFVGDVIPVNVEVESLGALVGAAGQSARVELLDELTGRVLDERRVDINPVSDAGEQASASVTLLSTPERAGEVRWVVRVTPDGPDLSEDNNRRTVLVSVSERPLRVVYFDGYPRWEYRFIKNLLARERFMRTSTLLLASDRRYVQDGNEILASIPRTQEEWNAFDVIILGDMRPGLFSTEQLAQIRRVVGERGAGLLWIGGPGPTPGAWRNTPLADLLPFALPGGQQADTGPADSIDAWLDPVVMSPGPAAQRYGVLMLSGDPQSPWPEAMTDPALGWPMLRWAQRINPLLVKPTAEVLAYATSVGAATPERAPLVLTMRYGAGRVVYVGTDETWRYRYGRGEVLPERFWIPVVRLLARESLGRVGAGAALTLSPQRSVVGQQVGIELRLIDQNLADRRPRTIDVVVTPEIQTNAPSDQSEAVRITLAGSDASEAQTGSMPTFRASWIPAQPGQFILRAVDPSLAGLEVSARAEVSLPDDELRIPQSDHESLAQLAAATNGAVIPPAELGTLPDLLPNRELRIVGTPDIETLWDKPAVLVLLLLMLTFEWVGRRVIKLS